MDNVRVGGPDGFPGLEQWLVGIECRRMVESKANEALMLYQAIVTKRTGRLALSAHASTEVAPVKAGSPRWVGVVASGRGLDYGLAHEFGAENARSRAQMDAAEDFNQVLSMLGAL